MAEQESDFLEPRSLVSALLGDADIDSERYVKTNHEFMRPAEVDQLFGDRGVGGSQIRQGA